MTRRIFDILIKPEKEKYQSLSGKPYEGNLYPNPEDVPNHLLKIVSNIHILECLQRRIEIMSVVRKFEQSGDTFLIPRDKRSLIKEYNEIEDESQKWLPFRN